jgi:hypothetical protein
MKQKLVVFTAALFIVAAFSAAFLFAGDESFTGYLGDNLCIERGVSLDGADMMKNPEKHSVHCALVGVCVDSGYSIMVMNEMGEYDVFKLDNMGNKLTVEFLKSLDRDEEIKVHLTGSLRAGRIRVKEINDAM